jgi:outer membrane scaffolding protein for murein synthesis (MipA/OmpV family)
MHTRFFRRIAGAACIAGLSLASPADAESLPLWEAGAGVAAVTLPDYRGADSSSTYILPMPYFVYRGEFLKADRNGVRSMLFNTERIELNLSLNATLPVRSKNNAARRGMTDLRPTVELGPTLAFHLWNSPTGKMKVDFRAPLRTAVTVESSPRQIGWLFAPNLNLDVKDPLGLPGWNLGLLTGPYFQSRRYNSYFYSVSPADTIPGRPQYDAPGGYAGSQFTAAVSKRFDRYWVGGFLRYDALGGASFENSPMLQRKNAISAGIAVTWVFGQSTTLVNTSSLDQ